MDNNILLSVKNLRTYFHIRDGIVKAVDGVSFDLKKGSVLGVVGESGCGKSITARSILRMVKSPGRSHGEIKFNNDGQEIDLLNLEAKGKEIRKLRGNKLAMIFQEPMNSLSPVHSIGEQIIEGLLLHTDMDEDQARDQAINLLNDVGFSNPGQRVDEYPHQLSGGMRQRAMIAMAISCHPDLLIADEPTTALDVSIQAQILKLLKDLQQEYGISIIFITHDLAVIAQIADKVMVMYLGQSMEQAEVDDIFFDPLHPYTTKLLESIPDLSKRGQKKRLEIIKGSVPEPINLPDRCVFYDRCPEVCCEQCEQAVPEDVEQKEGHWVRCFKYQKQKQEVLV